MAALAADGQCEVIAPRIVFANHRAGFHEIGDDARIDDSYLGDRVRPCERGLGGLAVADRNVEQHVAGMLRPDLGCVPSDRVANAGHRGELRPLHFNGLDGIARDVDGLGDDKGDGVADMAHFVPGKDRIRRPGERVVLEIEQARQVAEIADVVGRKDQRDAGQLASTPRIDGEFCVGMRRAQHQRMQRLRRRDIVGVAALAANEGVVFLAEHALTDTKLDGSHSVSVSRT